MAIININVVQFLPITQTDTQGIIGQIISQSLILAQTVDCSIKNESTSQPFNVQQSVVIGKVLHLNVANVLNLSQIMGQTYSIDIGNVLTIQQIAANVNPQAIIQGLAITHSVVPSRALENTLIVSQTLRIQGSYHPALIASLAITQVVAVFKTDAVNLYGIPVPDPIDPVPIVLTHGSTIITLKIPEIGDTDKINVKRVQEQTRGGDLIVFRDPIWSITETLKYKFTNLTRLRSQQLLKFFADTIGLSIQLRDYQGVIWNGIITTPEAEMICTNDNNCGSYDVEFEFQGNQV